MLLTWSPPGDTGGRADLTYSVECRRCDGAACQACGEKVRYEPASTGLTETRVSVSQLDAHLNYTFTVNAHNGVSAAASKASPRAHGPPSTAALTTSLQYTGEGVWGGGTTVGFQTGGPGTALGHLICIWGTLA